MNFQEFKVKYQHEPVTEYRNHVKNESIVSVCVQTYQHASYIRECLDGILMQQTDFPFEILVGEDNSTDGTREICIKYAEKYPEKIRLFLHHRKNNIRIFDCPTGRFNFLYNVYSAKGKYIALCPGDDYWTDPLKLQKQIDFLEANQDYVLCFHEINVVKENGEAIVQRKTVNTVTSYTWQDMFHITIPPLSVVFRNCIKEYPPEFSCGLHGDKFLFGVLSTYGVAAKLGFVGGSYRKHAGGVFSQKKILQQWRNSVGTRKAMQKSSYFNNQQKRELKLEIRRRNKKLIKKIIHNIIHKAKK